MRIRKKQDIDFAAGGYPRPKSKETARPRGFRFYDDEYNAWQARAERDGITLTEWLRAAATAHMQK